jgi:hypothetical protein
MIHVKNYSTWKAKGRGSVFKDSLGHKMIPCIKKTSEQVNKQKTT